jgi:hypothetical protein
LWSNWVLDTLSIHGERPWAIHFLVFEVGFWFAVDEAHFLLLIVKDSAPPSDWDVESQHLML